MGSAWSLFFQGSKLLLCQAVLSPHSQRFQRSFFGLHVLAKESSGDALLDKGPQLRVLEAALALASLGFGSFEEILAVLRIEFGIDSNAVPRQHGGRCVTRPAGVPATISSRDGLSWEPSNCSGNMSPFHRAASARSLPPQRLRELQEEHLPAPETATVAPQQSARPTQSWQESLTSQGRPAFQLLATCSRKRWGARDPFGGGLNGCEEKNVWVSSRKVLGV